MTKEEFTSGLEKYCLAFRIDLEEIRASIPIWYDLIKHIKVGVYCGAVDYICTNHERIYRNTNFGALIIEKVTQLKHDKRTYKSRKDMYESEGYIDESRIKS